jgi:hypothetical protein
VSGTTDDVTAVTEGQSYQQEKGLGDKIPGSSFAAFRQERRWRSDHGSADETHRLKSGDEAPVLALFAGEIPDPFEVADNEGNIRRDRRLTQEPRSPLPNSLLLCASDF